MNTTLKFPQDLLRFLYWVFFKPITLERYIHQIDPALPRDPSLFVLWKNRANSRVRNLILISCFDFLVMAGLLGIVVPLTVRLTNTYVEWSGDWSGVVRGLTFSIVAGMMVGLSVGIRLGTSFGMTIGMMAGVMVSIGPLWTQKLERESWEFPGWYALIRSSAIDLGLGAVIGATAGILVGIWIGRARGVASGVIVGMSLAAAFTVVLYVMNDLSFIWTGPQIISIIITAPPGGGSSISGPYYYGLDTVRIAVFSMAGGLTLGIPLGLTVGVASGVLTGIFFAIVVAGMIGIALGGQVGIVTGGVIGLSIAVGYYRVFLYAFQVPSGLFLSRIAVGNPKQANRCLRLSPIYWDEVIWLPLFGLDQHLITMGKHDRQAAQRAIADVTQSFNQQWAARNALIELTAYDVERAQNAQAIANIAGQFAWLPPTMPKDLENVLPPIRDIAAYAQAALESDTLYNQQTQLRNAIAQTQRVREGLALSSNRQIAARFGRALETWEQVLGKELSGLDAREVIPNVYVAGSPLATASKVFKGRHDLFVALERELASHAEQRPTLLLFGARRSGKTSAIKQMPVRLGPDVIPVEVDLQSAATAEDVRGLLFVLADQIKRNALTHRRVQLPSLTRDDLRADPYVVFGDWLNRVEESVGARWILLNLDEYERLTEMMDAGRIDQRVFDFLRGIIQHHPRITVLLSGSHTLEDLPPIWSDYLINVRVLKIENLKENEARELIVQPIENFPLEYEPAAVERILAVTGCQPFLLQATCRDLVNLVNEQNRTTATLSDADRALDSVLTTGVAYFQDLWGGRDSDDAQRAVMRAVATNKDLRGLGDLEGLNAALRKLVHRDILLPPLSETGEGWGGGFRVELVRRWVERNTS